MTETRTGVPSQVWDFLLEECAALDDHRHADWLGLLTDDFEYRIPVPLSREDPGQARYDDTIFLAHESKSFLQMRFDRVGSDYAWAERPVPFIRHFVSNLRLLDEPADGAWTVATNVLVVRSRQPEPTTMSSAGRIDTVVDTPDGLRLRRRLVYLDTEVPTDGQLGFIY